MRIKHAVGLVGAAAVATGGMGAPPLQSLVAPAAAQTDPGRVDTTIVNAVRSLSADEIAAADITGTPEGQLALSRVDLASFTPSDTSETALNRVAQGLRVYRFGTGTYQTDFIGDASMSFDVTEGLNAAGETVWDVTPRGGGDSGTDLAEVTGGRSVQAIPPNNTFRRYDEDHFNRTVGDIFDRHHDAYFFVSVDTKQNRRFYRAFFDGSGGPTEGTTRLMRSMWVELDRTGSWPARVESDAPQPQASQVGGENQCRTWGWGAGVTVQLPPIGFNVEQQMSNQLCRGDEQFDPVNRAEIASHGSKWNYRGDRQLSRSVATALIVDVAHKGFPGHDGWLYLTGQSTDNT